MFHNPCVHYLEFGFGIVNPNYSQFLEYPGTYMAPDWH